MLYSNLAVEVGGHATYDLGDLNSSAARVRRLSLALRSGVLAFLDAYLRASQSART